MSPGAVTASSWLRFIGGVIEVPRGGAHSCTSGKGNPLNFAVMRPDVKSKLLLRFDLDFEVPWKLHAGLRLVLKAPRDVIPVRVPLTAPCPELPALARNKRDAFEPSRPACMWQARVASATSAMTAKCSSPAKMSLRYVATGDAAEELGQRYVIFIGAVERYIYGQFDVSASCLAIDPPPPPLAPILGGWGAKRATSRAVGHQSGMSDARAREVFTQNLPGCAADAIVRWLGQLTTALAFWCRAIDAGTSFSRPCQTLRGLGLKCPELSKEVTEDGPLPTDWRQWPREAGSHERAEVPSGRRTRFELTKGPVPSHCKRGLPRGSSSSPKIMPAIIHGFFMRGQNRQVRCWPRRCVARGFPSPSLCPLMLPNIIGWNGRRSGAEIRTWSQRLTRPLGGKAGANSR